MPAFCRVNGDQAGPAALGILMPPGRRTLLIVRPRALAWDLLVVRSSPKTGPTTTFRDFGREEAEAASEGLLLALEAWAAGGPGRIEAQATGAGDGWQVRAAVGVFPLLACPREPGRPYTPLVCAGRAEADRLRDLGDAFRKQHDLPLMPPAGAGSSWSGCGQTWSDAQRLFPPSAVGRASALTTVKAATIRPIASHSSIGGIATGTRLRSVG